MIITDDDIEIGMLEDTHPPSALQAAADAHEFVVRLRAGDAARRRSALQRVAATYLEPHIVRHDRAAAAIAMCGSVVRELELSDPDLWLDSDVMACAVMGRLAVRAAAEEEVGHV
jgi:hypothetical protein